MEKLEFIGSCFTFSHYILLLYGFLAKVVDILFYGFVFFTGIMGILFFSMTDRLYHDSRVFGNLLIIGTTTFYSSIPLSNVSSIFASFFQWAVYFAFFYGSLRSMVFIDVREYRKRALIYATLNLILTIIYHYFLR